MTSLWKERLKKHQAAQLKYLRLIFNDQFVIALIFLIGSLGFGYSNFLKTITETHWWAKLIIALLITLLTSMGHLATLLQTADSTFLLPKEKQLAKYLKRAQNYSMIVPAVVIAAGMFLIYPFANIAGGITTVEYLVYIFSTYIFKFIVLDIENFELYSIKNYRNYFLLGIFVLVAGSLIIGGVIGALLTLIVAIISLVIDLRNRRNFSSKNLFQWNKAIKRENARSFNIKRFYNLFTDVPGMSSKIVRRKYLDFIPNMIKANHERTYIYIFSRGFIRNNEYIGLFLRLTIIEMMILFFVNNIYLAALISGLFLYLVGFQLKPFYKQYVTNIMQLIYPVKTVTKAKDFQKLVGTVLSIQWLLSLIPTIYVFHISLAFGIVAGIGLLVILVYVYVVLTRDLKKLDE